MRRTKIVCTIGPASSDKKTMKRLVEGGMNVARLNFSHGNQEEYCRIIKLLKEVENELKVPIGIMLDTRGPEIRVGELKDRKKELKKGEEIILISGENEDDKYIPVNYSNLAADLEEGSRILLDDGLIELKVLGKEGKDVLCHVITGGTLTSNKGINLPGVDVKLPALTDRDKDDIRFGIKNGIHFIAASFVRKAADVIEIKKLLEEEWARDIRIIAKIENQEGVKNIDAITEVADGIMVARGDLGVELSTEKIPVIQKIIINKCNKQAKPVITATQMLDSMIRNPRPTRAEASDVANAIHDGTDAIMLSGESAIGNYPVESVKTMARIAEETEQSEFYQEKVFNSKPFKSSTVTEAISYASCEMSSDLKTRAIITATGSGYTARMVSKNRSRIPIIAATPSNFVLHTLTLSWGVYPLQVKQSSSTDEMIENALTAALECELVTGGDLVTITAGVPVGISGTTNLIKVDVVGDPLLEAKGVGKGIIISGKVKFASTAEEAINNVRKGDILVTRMTNKQFEPALARAAAVVTAEGGLTSHPALIGLDYGIPVIVNAGNVFEKLTEGEIITVDGVRGLIYRGEVNLK
ncbi:MAG: pyruvate kinase [Halanaerobiales bacterium]